MNQDIPTKPSLGRFITLEGGDGSGKSTQAALIKDQLVAQEIKVKQTREPGGTRLSEDLRRWLLSDPPLSKRSELLLFFAARIEHAEQMIVPALQEGYTVICERYTDSTYAYQGGGSGLPLSHIAYLEATSTIPEPDLTLFFDLPPEEGLKRKYASEQPASRDRFEKEDLNFHKRVRKAYQQRAKAYPERIKVISAVPDKATISKQVQAVLLQWLESTQADY